VGPHRHSRSNAPARSTIPQMRDIAGVSTGVGALRVARTRYSHGAARHLPWIPLTDVISVATLPSTHEKARQDRGNHHEDIRAPGTDHQGGLR
jgi:hypothetical protein